MPSLKDIQLKIAAVKKTRQITRAMNMVAAAKLRQVQDTTERFKPYADKFGEVLGSLSTGIDPEIHPMLMQPEEVNRVALLLFTADRGLCGSFNMGLITKAEQFMKEREAKGQQVDLYCIGRRGVDFFKRTKREIKESMPGAMNAVDFDLAQQIGRMGLNAFLSGEVQEVHLVYSTFESMARMFPTASQLLPITQVGEDDEVIAPGSSAEASHMEYITEPSAEEILVDLLPRYINVKTYQALLETSTSENAARMAAMDNATKNCKEMIDNLTLAFNKARQAAITAELMDIVGGAEALGQG